MQKYIYLFLCCIGLGLFFYLPVEAAETTVSDANQAVVVTVKNTTTSYATITLYEREDTGEWTSIRTVSGRVGKNGIVDMASRKQNTSTTPAGVMNLVKAYGTVKNVATDMDYTLLTSKMYWDLNSSHSTYNRLVYKNPGGDYEHLINYKTYKYMVTTDYNNAQVKNKGGAIFLHCNGAGATAGCISMSESNMKYTLKWLDASKNPVIVVSTTKNLYKYFTKTSNITSLTRSTKGVKIKWNTSFDAKAYVVYRKTSGNASWTKLKTISGTNSYLDTTASEDITTYYTVRAYSMVDGEKSYASYNKMGWKIEKNKIKGQESIIGATATVVNSTALNVRTGAGKSYRVVKAIKKNKKVTISGKKEDSSGKIWYKVKFTLSGKSYTGYASSSYLKVSI